MRSCRAVEGDALGRVALQPALERNDAECPTECETCGGDCDVQEHHHVVVSPAHSGDGDLLSRKLEDKATAGEEERCESFGRRARGQDAARWAQPEEEVREASKDGEGD